MEEVNVVLIYKYPREIIKSSLKSITLITMNSSLMFMKASERQEEIERGENIV